MLLQKLPGLWLCGQNCGLTSGKVTHTQARTHPSYMRGSSVRLRWVPHEGYSSVSQICQIIRIRWAVWKRHFDSTTEPQNQNLHFLQVSQLRLRSRKIWEARKEASSGRFAGTWLELVRQPQSVCLLSSVVILAESCRGPIGPREGGVGGRERMPMQEGAKIVQRDREVPGRSKNHPPVHLGAPISLQVHCFQVPTKFHPTPQGSNYPPGWTHQGRGGRHERECLAGQDVWWC